MAMVDMYQLTKKGDPGPATTKSHVMHSTEPPADLKLHPSNICLEVE